MILRYILLMGASVNLHKTLKIILNDQTLISTYLEKGDMQILAELYQPYMPLIYGSCLRYLKNEADAEDAVMDIFEKIAKKLKTNRVKNFKAWIYTVTRNHCFEKLRQSKNKFDTEIDENFMHSELIFHPDEVTDEEPYKQLEVCMSSLEKMQYACLEMFYFKKMSYTDIAKALSIQYNQVRSRIQNGRRNLKKCLEQAGYDQVNKES